MSVDFVNGASPELIAHMKNFWGPRRDTVIHIEGLEGPPHGIPVTDFPGDADWAKKRSFATSVLRWLADPVGTNDFTKFVIGIKDAIEGGFDPRGRLIITGKSTGGVNALQLCRHLWMKCGWFRLRNLSAAITNDKPKGKFSATPPDNTPFTVKVRVDLICIWDASFDDHGFAQQRFVPPTVRTYANWFQTKDKDAQVHTTLIPFDAEETKKIIERDCTNEVMYISKLGMDAHVKVCKDLGPREGMPMIENELKTPTPVLTPTLRGDSTTAP
jgi:hypothetical protein